MAATERRKDCADCKAELTEKINKNLKISSVKWFVGFFAAVVIAVWGGGYGIYAGGNKDRDENIKKNEEAITVVEKAQITISLTLTHLAKEVGKIQTAQTQLKTKIENLPAAIVSAIKANK